MNTSSPTWQTDLPSSLDVLALRELLLSHSLTRALKAVDAVFSVRLLHLGRQSNHEFNHDIISSNNLFSRQVLLCLNDTPVLWAESRCEENSSWCGILDCGTQPLGERLFDGSLPLQRSPFEYAFDIAVPNMHNTQAWAARRSVFYWQQEPLVLAEYFLPSIHQFFTSNQ